MIVLNTKWFHKEKNPKLTARALVSDLVVTAGDGEVVSVVTHQSLIC